MSEGTRTGGEALPPDPLRSDESLAAALSRSSIKRLWWTYNSARFTVNSGPSLDMNAVVARLIKLPIQLVRPAGARTRNLELRRTTPDPPLPTQDDLSATKDEDEPRGNE